MKRFVTILGFVFAAVAGFIVYVNFTYRQTFEAPPTGIIARPDSTTIARGRYLVENVSHCQDCHASKKKGNIGGVALSGGERIKTPVADFYPPNLTPDKATGIGNFTDEQIARAVRYGIKHDGTALAPFMSFNEMSNDDLTAVVSYLRSTEPVVNFVPQREPNLLGKIVLRFIMKPNLTPAIAANMSPDSTAAYGKYLASSVGNCIGCHTQRNPMTGAFTSAPFSGGMEFNEEQGKFITPNLTPDSATGRLKGWDAALFVHRFKMGKLLPGSPMPWQSFQNMNDNDLKAIYYFLETLPPANNKIEATFMPMPSHQE